MVGTATDHTAPSMYRARIASSRCMVQLRPAKRTHWRYVDPVAVRLNVMLQPSCLSVFVLSLHQGHHKCSCIRHPTAFQGVGGLGNARDGMVPRALVAVLRHLNLMAADAYHLFITYSGE